MGLVVLIGLIGMSRMGVAAHYCAGSFVAVSVVMGWMQGAPLVALLLAGVIWFVVSYFWFRLLEAFEETIFAYMIVVMIGIVALMVV